MVVAAVFVVCPLAALAGILEERVESLEKHHAELYHDLEERKSAGLMRQIASGITLSGLLEIEATCEKLSLRDESDEDFSDLVLATAQLGLEAEVNEHLGATLIFLYEEGEDAVIEVDEATLNYTRNRWQVRVGRQYLPFGAYPSHFISAPLTNALGETRETALRVGFERSLFQALAFVFNGQAEQRGEAGHLDDWGVSVRANPGEHLELGASLLSNLANSGAELVEDMAYERRVAGWSAYGVVAFGPVELLGEVLGAVSEFADDDYDGDGDGAGDRPLAWNLEVAALADNVEVAGRIEGSDQLAGQPQLQYGACAAWGPWENVSLSLQVLRGEFAEEFGDGVDRRTSVIAQLATEF